MKGLGILKGEILKIPEQEGMKIPHMGWNSCILNTTDGCSGGSEKALMCTSSIPII